MLLTATDSLDDDFDSHAIESDDDACWSLDDLERSAELGSLRSAWAAGHDGIEA